MRQFQKSVIALATSCGLVGAIAFAQGGQGMQDRFAAVDEDADGGISLSEAMDWRDTVFLTMDGNDDMYLTQGEYMSVQLGKGGDPDARGPRYAARQAEKAAQFKVMDDDGDGMVSQEQFMLGGEAEFMQTDADKNGKITMSEFVTAHWM